MIKKIRRRFIWLATLSLFLVMFFSFCEQCSQYRAPLTVKARAVLAIVGNMEAMGIRQRNRAAMTAAISEAAREAGSRWVVFTGGDGGRLHEQGAQQLERLGLSVAHRPLLCLESLARLRPAS